MKKFTKIALIISLVAFLLGTGACAVGAGLGFSLSQFRDAADYGIFNISSYFWNDRDFDNDFDLDWGNETDWEEDEVLEDETDWEDEAVIEDDTDWEDEDRSGADWTKDTYTFEADKIKDLDIEFDSGQLEIVESESDSEIGVVLEYKSIIENSTRKLTCEEDNGVLKIDEDSKRKWNNLKKAYIILKLPKNKMFDEVDINTGAGITYLKHDLNAKDVKIEIGAGEVSGSNSIHAEDKLKLTVGAGVVSLNQLSAKNIDVDCGIGETTIKNVASEKLKILCGMGSVRVKLTDTETDYDYKIQCGVGSVSIGDSNYSGLGRSKKIDNNSSKTVDIDCGLGDVEIDFTEK